RGVGHPEPPGQVPQAERTEPVLGDGTHRLLDGGVAEIAVMVGTGGRAHLPSIRPHLYTAKLCEPLLGGPPTRSGGPTVRVQERAVGVKPEAASGTRL